jgi:hypothetical protein
MRAMRLAWLVVATLPGAGGADARGRVGVITYETQACHGFCPVYRLTVRSDGRGVFEGVQHTAVTGTRSFRVTPAQWRAFRRRLQADHPVGTVDLTGPDGCGSRFATDLPGVVVRWSGAERPAMLRVNYGCDAQSHARLFRALRSAPDVLPVAALIGRNGGR